MIRLSGRLAAAASFCGNASTLVDVGCDHAYIPIYLLEKGEIPDAVAIDINKGPLRSAWRNAAEEGMADRMEFILSDGLDALPVNRKYGTLLIAGIGGDLMMEILQRGYEKTGLFSSFVFSPHSKISEFRHFLGKNGFSITDEKMLSEAGKLYTIIKAEKGPDTCQSSFDYEFGPFFDRNMSEDVMRHIQVRAERYKRLSSSGRLIPEDRSQELEEKSRLCEEAFGRYEMQRDDRYPE